MSASYSRWFDFEELVRHSAWDSWNFAPSPLSLVDFWTVTPAPHSNTMQSAAMQFSRPPIGQWFWGRPFAETIHGKMRTHEKWTWWGHINGHWPRHWPAAQRFVQSHDSQCSCPWNGFRPWSGTGHWIIILEIDRNYLIVLDRQFPATISANHSQFG